MKKTELLLTALLVPIDAIVLFIAGISAYALRFTNFAIEIRKVQFLLPLNEFIGILFLVIPIWLLIFAANGLYVSDANRKFSNELSRIFFACTVGLAALTVFIFFRGEFFNSRFIVLFAWIISMAYIMLAHALVRVGKYIMYRRSIGTRHTVLLGTGPITDRIAEILSSDKGLGYTVIARYSVFNEKIRREILDLHAAEEVDEILLTTPQSSREETLTILTFAEEHQFTLKYSADLFATLAPNMRIGTIADIPIIEFRRARLDGWGKIIKRCCDIVGSASAIIITSPLLIGSALAIRFETGVPILFKNTRVGYGGALLKTLKFRSMFQTYCTEQEAGLESNALKYEEELIHKQNSKNGPIYKIAKDPRITKVGLFLRRWSLDELPQLFNVLRGEMSLVGPRPHQPREVAKYSPEDRRVHAVKPGITGLAQISGRSDLSFEDEIRLDMFYIENWSLTMDIFILLKTPLAVLRRRKAE